MGQTCNYLSFCSFLSAAAEIKAIDLVIWTRLEIVDNLIESKSVCNSVRVSWDLTVFLHCGFKVQQIGRRRIITIFRESELAFYSLVPLSSL